MPHRPIAAPSHRVAVACLITVLCALASSAAAAAALDGMVGSDGQLALSDGDRQWCVLAAGLHDGNWGFAGASPADGGGEGVRAFAMRGPGGVAIAGEASLRAEADGSVAATYAFTPAGAVAVNSLHVSADFAAHDLAGGGWAADDKAGAIPAVFGEVQLFAGQVRAVAVTGPGGRRLAVTFAEPTQVLIQDNRRWTQSFSLRIGPGATKLAAGQRLALGMRLSSEGGIRLGFDEPQVMAAGDEWMPLALDLEIEKGSALDFSGMGLQDAPAGKHGRVIARADGRFAFAKSPDTPQRFYGVNLCYGSQFLTHEESDRLAERFVRLGYNALRIHHYEGGLVDDKPAAAQWNATKLDQFDYLMAALAKRGIYVTTDLFVSRPVSAAELGLEGGKRVNFKLLVPVLPAAWDNWCAFTRRLLGHVNPYTKVRYADDPALAWLAMINEGNLENYYGEIPAIPAYRMAWNAWLAKRYPARAQLLAAWKELPDGEDPAAGTVALPKELGTPSPRVRDCLLFLAETEAGMYRRMTDFLRDELKCGALLTNTNAWTNRTVNQAVRASYDYVDDHFYIDHPQFLAKDWQLPSRCPNQNPISEGAPGGRQANFTRLWDKPFTITEFNYSSPGRFRGVGGILTGAMAAMQDWGGIWRFAYSHGRKEMFEPARMDYFNLVTDPLNQAADRAAICLFLRGDLRVAPHRVSLDLAGDGLRDPPAAIPHLAPRWNWLGWVTGVGTRVLPVAGGVAPTASLQWPQNPAGATADAYAVGDAPLMALLRERGVLKAGNRTDPARMIYHSETNELLIDAPRGVMVFDTPRTAGGYAPAGQTIAAAAAGVRIDELSVGATVFVSAVDGAPIASSRRLLVTHLTDLQNTGARFAESARQTLLDWGRLPHLVRTGSARVRLTLAEPGAFTVWALSTGGKRLEQVPATAEGTALTFTAAVRGPDGARMLYEVAR